MTQRSKASRRRLILGVVGTIAILGGLATIGMLVFINPESALRADLVSEFTGAYPAKPAGGGETIDVELVAAESTIEILDGLTTDVWSYNGSVPGPAIRVSLGDTLRVTVRNDLPASTTIHWHGIRVPNDMDGVPDVNQPHIKSGDEFIYEFTPPDAGTFWYHSHTDGSEQLERGLYGSLVVADTPDATAGSYDQDVVWVIDDWMLLEDGQIDPEFNTSDDRTHNGRWGTTMTVNAKTNETLEVNPGERIRLRLVNASNGRVYTPDFGGLEAQLIAVDGLTVGEVNAADELILAPGNRADLDITIPSAAGAFEIADVFTGSPQPLAAVVVAGLPKTPDLFESATNDSIPAWEAATDASVNEELVFETNNATGEWQWTINGAAFPDHEPFEVTQGEFVKIQLTNQTHPMHPIHIHGQFFKVLSRNGEPVDEPYFRDTVLLNMLDTVEIGMVPLDVGEWVVHCHIQEHAEAGMMTVMNVNPGST